MTDIEIWKTAISDGEPYKGYKVSNLGRMMSLNYRNTGKSELMNPYEDKKGYLQVNLSKNGETKTCFVHRIVAETFIPNPEKKPEVNHIDEDKTNNRVSNLEWKSHKGNCNHGTRNERIFEKTTNGKCSKKVLQFSKSGEFIREWPSVMECSRNGYDFRNVSACCLGKRKTAYGFCWEYK